MRIGELATATGLSREALRFYESRGLLRARRTDNGYRDYAPETVALVQYIRLAQQLGFTLAEVGEAVPELWATQGTAASDPAVAGLLQRKLDTIDERIAGLVRLRQELVARIGQACPLAQAEGAEAAPRRASIAASTASVRSTRS